MTTKAEIQDLLRFLSKEAKLPLAQAMSKIKLLQDAELVSPSAISQASMATLGPIFGSEAAAKPVLLAAKRVTKKRPAASSSSPSKRARNSDAAPDVTPEDLESSLALPTSSAAPDDLSRTAVVTNRAPLVLAFAVVSLERTMPRQPLSSRLSLAQAVVSLNSRSKAHSLGLEPGRSAEAEGWGAGARKVSVLGREVSAIKRGDGGEDGEQRDERDAALWGLDLEAMRAGGAAAAVLPIHRPEAARAYLVKAFAPVEEGAPQAGEGKKKGKRSRAEAEAEAERDDTCGRLLQAIRLVCDSWERLAPHELDRRAWSWYVAVRPEVEGGVAGWGGRGVVRLGDILDLRRKEGE